METGYEFENNGIKILKNKALYHVLFWVLFINYYGLIDNAFAINYNINWLGYTLGVGLFYVVSLWIMPQYFERKQYFLLLISLFVIFFIYNLLMLLILFAQTEDINFRVFLSSESNNITRRVIKNLYNFITYSSYGVIFWIFGFIKKQYSEKERIENENYTIEKDFLNSQINQHFLYNMLNLFYVKANRFSEYLAADILTFSELLRYSLKDENDDKSAMVLIEDEIEVVKKMIHLFDSRIEDSIIGKFEVNAMPSNFKIPANMLVLIYQKLLTSIASIEKFSGMIIDYSGEKLQIKVAYEAKNYDERVDFSLLKERLNMIYHTNYFFSATYQDKYFELIIILPQVPTN